MTTDREATMIISALRADRRDEPVYRVRNGEGRHGIYIASKTRHADRWKAMRTAGATIISTWIDEAGVGESPDLNDLWVRCISESATCAVLIVYRELHDVLKGAWIELGVALARGTPVFAVGLREYTVAHYHGIRHFDTIEEAFDVARAALSAHPAPQDKTEALRAQAFALPRHEQFRLAWFIAENLGYILASEPTHPAPQDEMRRALEDIAKEVFTDGTPTKAARTARAALKRDDK